MDITLILTIVIFFIIGFTGIFLIMKMQSSTNMKYNTEFGKKAKMILTIGIICLGFILLFRDILNIISITAGIIGLFIGEKNYYTIIYQKELREQKNRKRNIKNIDNNIDDYL
ncbi:MAG: hypothetical protein ACOCP8_04225 [archaeon]